MIDIQRINPIRLDGGLCMRRLIISNFRVGSWYLHDEIGMVHHLMKV